MFTLKHGIGVLAILFSLYVAFQAMLIASNGALYQIPQLEGDGGGGLIFALLCLIAGFLTWLRPRIAAAVFLVAAAVTVLVGLIYQDRIEMFWCAVPLVCAIADFYVYIRDCHNLRRSGRLAA